MVVNFSLITITGVFILTLFMLSPGLLSVVKNIRGGGVGRGKGVGVSSKFLQRS